MTEIRDRDMPAVLHAQQAQHAREVREHERQAAVRMIRRLEPVDADLLIDMLGLDNPNDSGFYTGELTTPMNACTTRGGGKS